jgi:hypothetical protein
MTASCDQLYRKLYDLDAEIVRQNDQSSFLRLLPRTRRRAREIIDNGGRKRER